MRQLWIELLCVDIKESRMSEESEWENEEMKKSFSRDSRRRRRRREKSKNHVNSKLRRWKWKSTLFTKEQRDDS